MARDRAADLPSTRWVIAHFELIVGRRAESKHTFIRVSRTTWAVIGVALLIPWAVVLWIAQAPSNPTAKATAANAVPKVRPKPDVSRLPAGRWGELEFVRITIEPPEDCIPASQSTPDSIRWVFKGYSEPKLSELLQNAGLTSAQQHLFDAPGRRETKGDTIVLLPDAPFVIDLAPAARAKIYPALAEFPENSSQQSPYRLRKDAADDWFDQTGLPPEIIALTKRLLYERKSNVFSRTRTSSFRVRKRPPSESGS